MSSYNSSVCFFPDGSTTGGSQTPPFVPCNPEAPVSACCPVGTSCLGNGVCLQSGGILRGGCTDQSWISPECPNFCTDTDTASRSYGTRETCRCSYMVSMYQLTSDGSYLGSQDAYFWLQRCSFSVASDSFTWACGLTAQCTNEDTFVIPMPNPTATDISGIVAVSSTGSTIPQTQTPSHPSASVPSPTNHSISTSNAASPNSADNSSGNCSLANAASGDTRGAQTSTTVGIAIGAPLLVLFLTALASTFWYRRKWKMAQRQSAGSAKSSSSFGGHEPASSSRHSAYAMQYQQPYEYKPQVYQPHELNNRGTIVEIGSVDG